uniref:Uncharacterized protein n=1 Tax=Romanomermis culicivorax TaxID=13658 RepID=A0A915HPI6_ROMCU
MCSDFRSLYDFIYCTILAWKLCSAISSFNQPTSMPIILTADTFKLTKQSAIKRNHRSGNEHTTLNEFECAE